MPPPLVTKLPAPSELLSRAGTARPALRLAQASTAGRVLQNSQAPAQRSLFAPRALREA